MRILIDTFRHPYVELEKSIRWPSVHLDQLRRDEAEAILAIVTPLIPSWIHQSTLVEPHYSTRLGALMHLGREFAISGQRYLTLLQIEAGYLGGGEAFRTKQGIAPAFETNRIYYKSRIIPISAAKSTGKDSNAFIESFDSIKLKEAIEQTHVVSDREHYWSAGSLLFDQMDFSGLNQKFSHAFAFGAPFAFETVFSPFVIEHLTLCLNLLLPETEILEQLVPRFHEIWNSVVNGVDPAELDGDTQEFWKNYYSEFQYQRTMSPSGNPHWHFSKCPGLKNL